MANTTTRSTMWLLDPILKHSVQDIRAFRDADCASDHNLVIAKTLLKLKTEQAGEQCKSEDMRPVS